MKQGSLTTATVCVAPFRLTPTTNSVQCLKVLPYVIAKKPAVVTSGQGVQELFGDLLKYVPSGDVDVLAATLIGELKRGKLSSETQERIELLKKKFEWETIWEQEEKIMLAAESCKTDDYRIFDLFK